KEVDVLRSADAIARPQQGREAPPHLAHEEEVEIAPFLAFKIRIHPRKRRGHCSTHLLTACERRLQWDAPQRVPERSVARPEPSLRGADVADLTPDRWEAPPAGRSRPRWNCS